MCAHVTTEIATLSFRYADCACSGRISRLPSLRASGRSNEPPRHGCRPSLRQARWIRCPPLPPPSSVRPCSILAAIAIATLFAPSLTYLDLPRSPASLPPSAGPLASVERRRRLRRRSRHCQTRLGHTRNRHEIKGRNFIGAKNATYLHIKELERWGEIAYQVSLTHIS